MSDGVIPLDDVEITGIEAHPPTESVKLYGPPGTGKTTQSAARVARLIRDYDYNLADVTWCTYRRSLATETLARLAVWDVIEPRQLTDPSKGPTRYLSTFHAVANRAVGGAGDPVGYGDKKDFAEKRNIRFSKRNPWDEPPGQLLFDVFQYAANNRLDPTDAADLNKIPKVSDLREKWQGDIGAAWSDWQDYKRVVDKIDYWEMLAAPLRQNVTPGRDVLVIDEYHDAYPLMAALAEYWADAAEIVIVAGDPNQVVNNYAGASPEYFERFDLPEVLLDKTYRVPFEHWGVASRLLANAHDPPQVERQGHGSFHVGNSPAFIHDKERGWNVPEPDAARGPVWFVREVGTDVMFLTRTQKQADGVAYALEKAGVLYKTQKSMDRDGWGAAGDDMSERTAVYNALQKISGLRQADLDGGSGLNKYADMGENPENVTLAAREAAALLNHTNHKYLSGGRGETTKATDDMADDGGTVTAAELNQYVTPEFWDVYTRGHGSVRRLNRTSQPGENLSDRDLEALKVALEENDGPVTGDVETKVYTIHASKGTEAENVVVYDGITRRIQQEIERDDAAERNEWRTWYVALTRANTNLFVLRGGFEWTISFLPDNLTDMARRGRAEGPEGAEA